MTTAACATLHFPPPHSPNFNPIETASAEPKALLRKAAARIIPIPAIAESTPVARPAAPAPPDRKQESDGRP